MNQEVKNAVNFGLTEIRTTSHLKKIIKAKQQIVSGINYEVEFELENKEIWTIKVYKDLSGNYSLLDKSKQK
ncbi:cystatin domain-containing protein [Flammeovirga kamogawensis]|uniref:Cystatin domain-containing protein n=1 Tax=Flammeovirga kamogawensis TaxID=373891 RepID=A0ABX8H088_9BACT|nr:hypothetical protein KM029_17390 [Flammeovirga kamogawensis]TRX70153.1 pyruvate dehydrogenase [Flammeovirga kamogawensis]